MTALACGDREAARAAWLRAVDLGSGLPTPYHNLAVVSRGAEERARWFTEAIRRDHDPSEAHRRAADFYYNAIGDESAALRHYEAARGLGHSGSDVIWAIENLRGRQRIAASGGSTAAAACSAVSRCDG